MKKILVPCDFSPQAINAFTSAVSFGESGETEIHLLHVVELPVLHDAILMPVMTFEQALFQELEEKAEKEFIKITASNKSTNVKVITKVSFGATARMIQDYIRLNEIDLVVMGTRGATGLREVFIGSNTEKVVRYSPVPVIVVRKAINVKQIRNIVFPNDLSTMRQETLVKQVKQMQAMFNATLHIVWINTPTNFTSDIITRARLSQFAERFLLKDYTVNIFNDIFEENGISSFASFIQADMIAIGTHGRKGLAHVFSGSVTEDLVNHVDMPVWTFSLGAVEQNIDAVKV